MRERRFVNVLVLLFMCMALILTGCGSSDDNKTDDATTAGVDSGTDSGTDSNTDDSTDSGTDDSTTDDGEADPVLGVESAEVGNTSFLQSVAMEDSDYECFPGQANGWDIDADFSLSDGGDDQFDNALVLSVGSDYFSYQTYGELTFYSPGFQAADGVKVAAVADAGTFSPITGTYSVCLNNVYDGTLSQVVDLTGATAPITMTWEWGVYIDGGYFDMTPYLNVVVRDASDGSLLETLVSIDSSNYSSWSESLDAYAGQSVIISFEISSNTDFEPNMIDDISVTDGGGTEYITNGDFETGDLTGWSVNDPVELQNMTSSPQTLSGLDVTRSFYTVPNKLWGRWVDVFDNPTTAAITATVTYETDLGSDGAGILYLTPGADGQALTGWDGDNSDRDLGLVFGSADTVGFTTATDIDMYDSDGSDEITHTFTITVEPGQKAALVNFIIMNGIDTADTATDATALATAIDEEANTIIENFWTDGQYRTGMTQEQIDAIVNF